MTQIEDANVRRAVLQIFSTVTSSAFSEFVMVLWSGQFACLLSDVTLFETLRLMTKVRSFKLVFCFTVLITSLGKGKG